MREGFLNVDLEIRSAAKLDKLLAEMGDRVLVYHCGPAPRRHLLAVHSARHHRSPDSAIHTLCDIVESMTPAARRLWDAASKTFDVGYEISSGLGASSFSLRAE